MEKPQPPIFTDHRRKRLILWALTVLGWLAAVVFGERAPQPRQMAQRFHHLWLDQLTRTIITLLLSRALQLAKVRLPRRIMVFKRGRDLRRGHFIRSYLGFRLRRLLTQKDFATRIAQLAALLRDLDTHARYLARRLCGGLRRLWRITPPMAAAVALRGARAPLPALADSS